ncbi:MAG: ABC transporter permease, partial [Xanthomonadales bacterium]|nr:ABC transporter permease [Xanthomonadales bacterium]
GAEYPPGEFYTASPRMIDAGYLQALQLPLRAGRLLQPGDDAQAPPALVVSESLAHLLWADRDPLGEPLTLPWTEDRSYGRVVGVVADVPRALDNPMSLDFYLSIDQQSDWGALELVVRSERPVSALAAEIRTSLRLFDPDLAVGEVAALDSLISHAVAPHRLTTTLLSGFSAAALLVAALGIYSVVAFAAEQRQHDLAIRRAVGAPRGHLAGLVLRDGLGLALVGAVLGCLLAGLGGGALRGLWYGVDPLQPWLYVGSAVLIVAVTLAASGRPALRAARVDASRLLR